MVSKLARQKTRALRLSALAGAALAALCLCVVPASAAKKPKQLGTLNVAVISGADVPLEYAYGAHLFSKLGLTVNIKNVGGQVDATLISGQADIGSQGAGSPLVDSGEGEQTVILNQTIGGGASGSVAGPASSSVNNLTALKALGSNCTVETFPPGSSSYADALAITKNYQLGCKLNTVASVPIAEAALSSGSANALVTSDTVISPAIASGIARSIYQSEPGSTSNRQLFKNQFVEGADYALPGNVKRKFKLFVAFEKGLAEARAAIKNKTAASIANVIAKNPDGNYTGQSQDAIIAQVQWFRNFMCGGLPYNCYIPKSVWTRMVPQFANFWGLSNFQASSPNYSYAKQIDMAPYVAANGIPKAAKTKKK